MSFRHPSPAGVTAPRPVTTIRLFERVLIASYEPLGLFLNVIQSFPDRQNLFGVLVGNLDAEFFFEGHHQLNRIERVGTEVFDETGFGRDLILFNSELLSR